MNNNYYLVNKLDYILKKTGENDPGEMFETIKNQSFDNIIKAILILVVGFTFIRIVYRFISKAVSKSALDPVLHGIIKQAIKMALQVAVILAALDAVGINISGLTAIFGALGLAFSLAAKDSISDLASGITILINKEFTVGDYVTVGANDGTIQKVTLSYIMMNTKDNRQIYIPNSTVAKSIVINHSREEKRRIDINLEIASTENIDRAKGIIMEVVTKSNLVLLEDDPEIVVTNFTASTTTLMLRVWTKTEDQQKIKYYLYENIKKAFVSYEIK